jgi:nucleotide-binding universal stress UspA family protein
MMRTLLVPLAEGIAVEPPLDAALVLAKRLKSHVRAVWARPDPNLVLSYVPDAFAAAGVTRDAIEREGRQAADAAKARFDAWQADRKVPGAPADMRLDACFASWSDRVGEIEALVTRFGRVSDMVVVGRFAAGEVTAARLFDAAVFGAGRPTLLAPPTLPWDPVDHVMIAWNGSLEASRAVFAAMPLLHAAGRVSIFAAAEHGSESADTDDLAESLVWHGIHAQRLAAAATAAAGPALLEAAKQREATLIVMGAYTHSRLRQSFLGGVTSHVLAHAEIPVLLSH